MSVAVVSLTFHSSCVDVAAVREGFVGAFFATLLTGFFISRVLSQFQLMICEKDDLTLTHPSCAPALPYIPVPVPLPQGMQGVLSAVVRGTQARQLRTGDSHATARRRVCSPSHCRSFSCFLRACCSSFLSLSLSLVATGRT